MSLNLINDEQKVILVCQVCRTVRFDKNFHAYVIEKTNQYDCILSANLISPFLVIIAQCHGVKFNILQQLIIFI